MLSIFKSEIEHESKTVPGVRFTVRSLNVIEKAAREANLLDARARMAELQEQERCLCDEVEVTDEATGTKRKTLKPKPGSEREVFRAREEWAVTLNRDVYPELIRAGFISLTYGEETVKDAEALLHAGSAANELIYEIALACSAACELSEEQRKNLESPSTSTIAAPEGESVSTAPVAD